MGGKPKLVDKPGTDQTTLELMELREIFGEHGDKGMNPDKIPRPLTPAEAVNFAGSSGRA